MKEDKIIENIIKKSQIKIAVSEFAKEKKEMPKINKISKYVATTIITLGIGTGIVYATGTAIYDKIWKQPESYKVSNEITEKDKENAISEEDARKKAEEYLRKIGLDDEINGLKLNKSWQENDITWNIEFTKGSMIMDNKGNFESLNIPSYNYTIPYNYGITREEARKTAKELLAKYNPENNNDEYELVSLHRNMENDKASYIWYADFYKKYGELYKKYGELYNMYEKISIGWIPTINGLYSLNIENSKYENNEQIITKEEAIRIATERDKKIETRHNIATTEAQIGIDKMNADVVYREKDIENYNKGTINYECDENGTYKIKDNAEFYKVDNRVRKVWEVKIFYDYYNEYYQERYVYYVDATTGEIIGGNSWSGSTEQVAQLIESQYNLIEK